MNIKEENEFVVYFETKILYFLLNALTKLVQFCKVQKLNVLIIIEVMLQNFLFLVFVMNSVNDAAI
jgi:hypothetical protein